MERRATLGRHPHWAAALRFTRHSRISIPRQRAGKRGRNSWCAFNADIALIFLPAHRDLPRPPSSTSSRQRWNILLALGSRELRNDHAMTLSLTQNRTQRILFVPSTIGRTDPDTLFQRRRRDMGQRTRRESRKRGEGRERYGAGREGLRRVSRGFWEVG